MALVTCTNCGAKLNTKNPMAAGKKVNCPKCKTVFVVQDEAAVAEEAIEDAPPQKLSKAAPKEDASIKEGDAPRSKTPAKPTARDEDGDDPDDAPPRKKRMGEDDADEGPAQKVKLAKDLPRSRKPFLAITGVVLLGIICSVATVAACIISMDRERIPRGPNRFNDPAGAFGGRKKVGNEGDGQALPGMAAVDADARVQAREDAKKREQGWLQAIRKLPPSDEPGTLAVFDDPEGRLVRAAFSPTEPLLAIATQNSPKNGIKLVDLRTLKVVKTILTIIDGGLIFSPDGKLLVAASRDNKTIQSWTVADGKPAKTVKLTQEPSAIAFTSDGSHLLVNLEGAREVTTFKLPDWTEAPFEKGNDVLINYVLMPGTDKILIEDRTDFQNERLIVQDLATGKRKYLKLPKIFNLLGGGASPDGRWYAWDVSDEKIGRMMVIDLENDQTATVATAELFKLGPHPVFTPDGKYLVYHVKDKQDRLRFVDVADKTEYASVPGLWSLNAFSPGGVFWIRQMGSTVFLHAWEDLKK